MNSIFCEHKLLYISAVIYTAYKRVYVVDASKCVRFKHTNMHIGVFINVRRFLQKVDQTAKYTVKSDQTTKLEKLRP